MYACQSACNYSNPAIDLIIIALVHGLPLSGEIQFHGRKHFQQELHVQQCCPSCEPHVVRWLISSSPERPRNILQFMYKNGSKMQSTNFSIWQNMSTNPVPKTHHFFKFGNVPVSTYNYYAYNFQ